MPFQFHKIPGFDGGLINKVAPRNERLTRLRGLSKAQNISLDVGGSVRAIGGLADFTKVDGATALTQTAKIAPGSGLFTYGSDHWRGTDTIVDLLAADNAASDEGGEVDAVGSWSVGSMTAASVADTDGGTIASNGTSYVMKGTLTASGTQSAQQTATTVIGQRYIFHVDVYCKDATYVRAFVASTYGQKYSTAAWLAIDLEFIATGITSTVSVSVTGLLGEIMYFDDAYFTAIARRDLDADWLALLDAPNAQIDLYDVNSNSFTAALLDFGTASSYVATIDKINFPTTKTITDANGEFLNQGVQTGDIRIISGCTSETANNIMFVVEHVTAGTIRARGNPFIIAADEDGTVTLTKYNPVAFHYVNEALRASPANGGVALRPKHYSFADRTHFEGTGTSERKFANWYANDVGPVAPTSVSGHTTNGNVATQAELVAGTGFEVGITRTADDGKWAAGTYTIAIAFKYDDGQISALYVPVADEEFGTAILDGDSLTLTVRGKMSASVDYDERISGGYVFCRKDESDEPWSLLTDISMAKGARATLSGTYNAWAESDTEHEAYTANFKSIKLNLDSYESLAGIDPTTTVETFSGDNAFWNASVIGGNRCFIFAPRYTDAGGNLQQFRDRIMYSQVNAYDTFPIDNIIGVVKGDAEDYVMGGIYGNDLLAFKSRTLYIIDISDPDPAGWQMKQDKNKGKYPRRGVAHPGAYFETPHGPAWCNEFGVFLYTGGEIVELLKDKIELSEHPLAYQRYMEFDGSNDYVTKSNDADLNFGANTDFSLEVIFKIDTIPADYTKILNKGSTDYYQIVLRSTGVATAWAYDGANEASVPTATSVDDGEWHHLIATFDRDGNISMYLGGAADGTPASMTSVLDIDDVSEPFLIGIAADLSSDPFDGDITLLRVWNRVLTAAEVLALYNGQPVLAADQWGAMADLVTAAFENSVGSPYDTFAGADENGFNAQTASDIIAIAGSTDEIAFVTGVTYRVEFDLSVTTGNPPLVYPAAAKGQGSGASLSGSYETSAAGQNVFDFTITGTSQTGSINFQTSPADTVNYTVSNFACYRVGCVAEFAPKNIGDATWVDESTNDLDGTVVGATPIYEDSWAKFWTNYSILGHHARTNQLIIMRDCTGKWSSGQDYGDCWTIDLDTLANTTGRRVFTKGIAYSNWATDWNQELIIAEQTSTTSVTIKQWTDEPQSQAVGLIDIRTADIDFGNPAYAKFFDALVAFYKSSAAQTTPVSYAIDGDDRQTAWTRITGNFDAEGFWEKLTLEPTTFECDTIRFKIDNPTAAGTMELLNGLTLRYSTEEEDID